MIRPFRGTKGMRKVSESGQRQAGGPKMSSARGNEGLPGPLHSSTTSLSARDFQLPGPQPEGFCWGGQAGTKAHGPAAGLRGRTEQRPEPEGQPGMGEGGE